MPYSWYLYHHAHVLYVSHSIHGKTYRRYVSPDRSLRQLAGFRGLFGEIWASACTRRVPITAQNKTCNCSPRKVGCLSGLYRDLKLVCSQRLCVPIEAKRSALPEFTGDESWYFWVSYQFYNSFQHPLNLCFVPRLMSVDIAGLNVSWNSVVVEIAWRLWPILFVLNSEFV